MSNQTLHHCPNCGNPLKVIGRQTYPKKYNIPPRLLVECVNSKCQLYGTTCTVNDLNTAHNAIQKQKESEPVKIYSPVPGWSPYSLTRISNRPTIVIQQAIMLCNTIVIRYIKRGDYYKATAFEELYYHLMHELYKRKEGITTFNDN